MVFLSLRTSVWMNLISLMDFYLVVSSEEDCGRVFETLDDHALHGHALSRAVVVDEFECLLRCKTKTFCASSNVYPSDSKGNRICELNRNTKWTNPADFKSKKGSTYFGSVQATCKDDRHEVTGKMISVHCHPGYKGTHCQITLKGRYSNPGKSCKDIRDSGDSLGNKKYWIDPEKIGNPFKVFCDMTTDGGKNCDKECYELVYRGWLLVSNVVLNSPSDLHVKLASSYHGINSCLSNQMFLGKIALQELMNFMPFTQLRLHCSKQQGRTFHVTTAANSSGKAVVQYLSGQTNDKPDSCGSFVRMEDDDSNLAKTCDQWKGGKGSGVPLGKWGEASLYDHTAFIGFSNHWLLETGRFECDDFIKDGKFFPLSSGDFWKVYVR